LQTTIASLIAPKWFLYALNVAVTHLPRMTDLAAGAFMDDETFGDFMDPYRHEFPEDYAASWAKQVG